MPGERAPASESAGNSAETAAAISGELLVAAGKLKAAIVEYGAVHDRAGGHLENTESIPKPAAGLDPDLNELYELWRRFPARDELEELFN